MPIIQLSHTVGELVFYIMKSKGCFTSHIYACIIVALEHMKEQIENEVSRLRQEKGVTQEDLASKVGVSRQTIIALEKGNYTPSILLALKIAGFFKTSVERIFKIIYEK